LILEGISNNMLYTCSFIRNVIVDDEVQYIGKIIAKSVWY